MIFHVDGFLYGPNPSDIGGGFTICDETGKVIKRVERLKKNFTNNEAELLAVAEAAIISFVGDTIITDSQNTISWIKNPKGNKARPDLADVCRLTDALIKAKQLKLEWKRRDENLAGLVNEELNDRTQTLL